MESILHKPARKLAKLICNGTLSPVELLKKNLEHIKAVNPLINAFVDLRAHEAMEEAEALEARIATEGRSARWRAFQSASRTWKTLKGW